MVASMFSTNRLSVSSSLSRFAGAPFTASTRSTSSTKLVSRNWGTAFTAIVSAGPGRSPASAPAACNLVEHPAPRGQDQPGFFGQADEFGQAPPSRAAGCCQRTSASTPTTRPVRSVAAGIAAGTHPWRGGAQVAFQRGALRHGGLHVGVEKRSVLRPPSWPGTWPGRPASTARPRWCVRGRTGDANAGRAAVLGKPTSR